MDFKIGEWVRINSCSVDFLPYSVLLGMKGRIKNIIKIDGEIHSNSLTILEFNDTSLNDMRMNIVLLKDLVKIYHSRKRLDPNRLPK